MKSWNFVFLFLLVCSLGLPSIDFVYAEPITRLIESGEIITATEDQILIDGIIINEGGELIIDSGVTLNINGAVINSGKISIDGNLIVNGIIVNNSEIIVRCGILDTSAAPVLGNALEFISCETGTNEIMLDGDFTVIEGESLFVPPNKVLMIFDILEVEGTLDNQGKIENKGYITSSNNGKIQNFGTIHSICENFEGRGIDENVKIVGPGELTGTTCSAPVSVNDDYSIDEDEILTVDVASGVLANDSDADTDSTDLKTKITTNSISGTTSLNPDGSFTYIPNADYFGADSFEYKVSDGTGGKTTGLVTLDVLPVSETPVSMSDAYSTDEDTPLVVSTEEGVLANDSDSDTDRTDLKTEIIVDPTFGTITLNPNGSFTYIPNADYFGADSFEYKVSDDENYATASVAIDVLSINDAPTTENDAYTTDEDTLLSISSPGVLANDADVDSIDLTVVVTENTTSGVVVLENDGVFTYIPNADYFGADSFTYSVTDNDGETNTATVAITVTDVNDSPVANDDSETTLEDIPVLVDVIANDNDDVDGTIDPATVSITSSSLFGTTSVDLTTGVVTYTPDTNYFGADSFVYSVADDDGETVTATVAITVTAVNDAPVANNDAYSTNEDTLLTIISSEVLANDADVDSTDLTVAVSENPTSGTITLDSDGVFTYTPNADYFGADSFTYSVTDDDGETNTATVEITVTDVNDSPVATDDSETTLEDIPVLVNVIANDDDVDGTINPTTVSITSSPTSGATSVDPTSGDITYTPNADYFGADSFVYSVADDDGETVTATVAITVTAVNDAPVATNDAYPVNEDDTLVVSAAEGVLANDADVDSTDLTVAVSENPTSGTITLNSDGSFTYTPDTDYFGDESFEYQVSDGENKVSATVAITITDVNDPPVISDPISITVEATGFETPLSVIGLSEPTVTDLFDSTPIITNDALAAFPIGTTTVTWTATDSSDAFATATQLITLEDTTNPIISTPSDLTVEATGLETPLSVIGLSEPSVTDTVDSTPTITNNAPETFPLGDTTVIWTATDASGNSVTATQLITLEDTTNPIISTPSDLTVEATGLETLQSSVSLVELTVTDTVDSTPTITNNAPETFPLGDTTVIWTATDASGNSATATQLVTLEDTTNPVILAPIDLSVLLEDSEISASFVDLGEATATDIVDLNPAITNDAPRPFLLGVNTVTWTATDASGNSATATQLVTLEDTTAPVILAPSRVIVEATGLETPKSSVSLGEPTVTDNADLDPTIENNVPDVYLLGNSTIVWTATDTSGNSATATQLVTLEDTTSPVITAPSEVSMSINGFELSASLVSLGEPTVTDTVDSTPTITNDAPEVFSLETTTVTWTATDTSGNFATATQLVTIDHITLLDQKISLTQQIESLVDDTTHEDSTYELEKAINDITKSIDQTKWEENKDSLNTDDGEKVFDDQRKGVKHIIKVLQAGNESDEVLFELANILLDMVEIDMQLAENSFYNASNSEDADKKCIDKASDELEKAKKYQSENKFDKAIEHYGKVWENSKKSHDKPHGKHKHSPCDRR